MSVSGKVNPQGLNPNKIKVQNKSFIEKRSTNTRSCMGADDTNRIQLTGSYMADKVIGGTAGLVGGLVGGVVGGVVGLAGGFTIGLLNEDIARDMHKLRESSCIAFVFGSSIGASLVGVPDQSGTIQEHGVELNEKMNEKFSKNDGKTHTEKFLDIWQTKKGNRKELEPHLKTKGKKELTFTPFNEARTINHIKQIKLALQGADEILNNVDVDRNLSYLRNKLEEQSVSLFNLEGKEDTDFKIELHSILYSDKPNNLKIADFKASINNYHEKILGKAENILNNNEVETNDNQALDINNDTEFKGLLDEVQKQIRFNTRQDGKSNSVGRAHYNEDKLNLIKDAFYIKQCLNKARGGTLGGINLTNELAKKLDEKIRVPDFTNIIKDDSQLETCLNKIKDEVTNISTVDHLLMRFSQKQIKGADKFIKDTPKKDTPKKETSKKETSNKKMSDREIAFRKHNKHITKESKMQEALREMGITK